MSFSLPSFNLLAQGKANYNWAAAAAPVGPFILPNTPINLAFSRRISVGVPLIGNLIYGLIPAGVAFKGKDSYAVKNGDAIEVPQASGRWYTIIEVEQVALGFPNAHQALVLAHPWSAYPTTTYLFP